VTRVLLTGAGGFVGSHVLRHLLAKTDWTIVCPVTFRHRGVADRIRLALADMSEAGERVEVVRCDLATPISAQTAHEFGDIEYIFNVASESHVDRSIDEPASFILNNVALAVHLFDYARTLDNLRVLIQVSTDEVYGPAPEGHDHYEWLDGHRPSNPYSASKAAQEDVAFSYWRTYDMPLVISNTMNIIGEMQSSEKFVPKTLKRVLAGETMTIHASPEGQVGSRFYLHARNQADGLLFLARTFGGRPFDFTKEDPVSGVTEALHYSWVGGDAVPPRYHVVGEREIDNLEMARLIADAAGRELKYELVDFHSSRPGHDLRYALAGQKLLDLGWKHPMPLEDSLRKTIEWTLSHPEWLL
jgi:dTDP-glucose 4,6-dehydratase